MKKIYVGIFKELTIKRKLDEADTKAEKIIQRAESKHDSIKQKKIQEAKEKGYDVLVMDYRTYGKSTGELSEAAFYKDAQFCYNYLLNHYTEDKITLYGRSLGTGIASYLAAENNPKQLILETPYYSIEDVAKSRFPMFPVKYLLKYKFPTHQFLPKANCLVTILHGTDDSVVPYSSSRKLLDLNIKNLNYVTIKGGNHNNLIEFEEYHKSIKSLLN